MYRKISDETRQTARAMLKAGKQMLEVSRALDLSRATVYRIKYEQVDEDVEGLAKEIRKEMANRYFVLADTILRGINDRELNIATLKEKAIEAAIFTDKATQLEKMGLGNGKHPEGKELETGLRQVEGNGSS
jgi:hypothetical protein